MNEAVLGLRRIALAGLPNCGKTALFNRLTGSHQKVANYPGVTVERKSGELRLPGGGRALLLDLPGTYSLEASTLDEQVARDVCLGRHPAEPPQDLLLFVADATNLRLGLRCALELAALGRPMVLALNMMDLAQRRGVHIDTARLAERLGMPVVETVARRRDGVRGLVARLGEQLPPPPPAPNGDPVLLARRIYDECVRQPATEARLEERLDAVLLSPVLGLPILALVLFATFQAVYTLAEPAMNGIEAAFAALSGAAAALLPSGALQSLISDGLIAGLGAVLVFLPQILILFLIILLLEESGYLPRAAFLLDRLMVGAGLSGRSFIPLLSSFACAVPGIMATRAIPDARDRLATILVAPLMTCSARLPVYTLLIAAFVPAQSVLGGFSLQGLVLFGLYVAGIASALLLARALKWLRRGGDEHALLLELPKYQVPSPLNIALGLLERLKIFLRRVGGVILSMTVLLWFLASYPAPPAGAEGPAIHYSLAGVIGRAMQPLFEPLGFGWEICVALIPGMAAREVAISSLATVYALSGTEEAVTPALGQIVATQWSLPTALALLAWYVFAPQCLSTIATVRRETNSRGITAAMTVGLFALAWLAALVTYRISSALLA